MKSEITVEELKELFDRHEKIQLLDVREKDEFEIANLGGKLIPLLHLPSRLDELNPVDPLVVLCHSGNRSATAANYLRQNGFSNVRNLTGGINAWAARIDPTMKRY